MTNKELGNKFEHQLCGLLSEQGFWVHNVVQNAAGQPADIIAVKKQRAYLIDCKVCSCGGFPFRRIESNQETSMGLWKDCGNKDGYFAFLIDSQIIMIPHTLLTSYRDVGNSTIRNSKLIEMGTPFEKWVKKCK